MQKLNALRNRVVKLNAYTKADYERVMLAWQTSNDIFNAYHDAYYAEKDPKKKAVLEKKRGEIIDRITKEYNLLQKIKAEFKAKGEDVTAGSPRIQIFIDKVKNLKQKLSRKEFMDFAEHCYIAEKPVLKKLYDMYVRGELKK